MVAIYVHIPFCTKKCPYCHFFVLPNKEFLKSQLLEGLLLEWEQKKHLIKEPVTSIYFGGGTPSLHPEAIESLLSLIPHTPSTEITCEYNPENVFLIPGINRISLGIQSLVDHSLISLERTHNKSQALFAIEKAAAITQNVTIDLMYDLPSQTLASWKKTLAYLENLPITHLSLYNLTIEPNTPFAKRPITQPSDETSLAMLKAANDKLESLGLARYEISAFAKPGYQSKHNTTYWKGLPFFGLGPSAFSYYEGRRFRNHCNLTKYLKALQKNQSPVDFEEKLPYPQNVHELLAVRLRLLEGADLRDFELPKSTQITIATLLESKLLAKSGTCISLTEKGLLFYDSVATVLI